MPSYVVPIKSTRLSLPCGEWVEVKSRLNHGEHQDILERCYRVDANGDAQRLPFRMTEAIVTAYVVDWSLLDLDDQPLSIRGCAPAEIELALRGLEQWVYNEIRDAVNAHVATINKADAEKKDSGMAAANR